MVSGVNLITFNTGYGIGLTSPMLGQLTGLYLDEDNFSWFASSLVIGQIIGSLVGSTIANSLGRKKTCMLAALFSSCGWAMLAASQNFWMLIVARIITGLFDCLAIPGGYMYISEVSETRLKGSFLNSNAIASGLGIAFGYLFGSNFLWRYTCFVALLVNASGIMTFLLCYESPVFLLMKNQVSFDFQKLMTGFLFSLRGTVSTGTGNSPTRPRSTARSWSRSSRSWSLTSPQRVRGSG